MGPATTWPIPNGAAGPQTSNALFLNVSVSKMTIEVEPGIILILI